MFTSNIIYNFMRSCLIKYNSKLISGGILFLLIFFLPSKLSGQVLQSLSNESFRCGDSLLDVRNNKYYPTVQLGTQCWMTRNMDIGRMAWNMGQYKNGYIEKSCYDNDYKNCLKYGGLYTWDEAMAGDTTEKSRGICPEGWHIPSIHEWHILADVLGSDPENWMTASFQSENPALSMSGKNNFHALPAGNGFRNNFGNVGQETFFWSSTNKSDNRAWFIQLNKMPYPAPIWYKGVIADNYYIKSNGFSVRCIKDQ